MAVDDELPRPHDIIISRETIDGRLQYTIEVTNTNYKRIFFADEARVAAKRPPVLRTITEWN